MSQKNFSAWYISAILIGGVIVLAAIVGYLYIRSKTPSDVSGSPTALVAPLADADQDGVPDATEATRGTDPKNADSDRDGLSDLYEISVSNTDPKNAHSKDPNLTDAQWLQRQAPPR